MHIAFHSGAEAYLSDNVSTSRFGICKETNILLGSDQKNVRVVCSNGRKTTFEWPKVVSEVIFFLFWGVVGIEKFFSS